MLILLGILSCGKNNTSITLQNITPGQIEIARAAEQKALMRGKAIWFDQKIGKNEFSCHSCHEGGFLTNPDKYPRYKHPFRSYAPLFPWPIILQW